MSTFFGKSAEFCFEVIFALLTIQLLDFNIALVGLVYFFRLIPYLFASPIGGLAADTFTRRSILVCCDWLRVAVLIAIAGLLHYDALNMPLLISLSMALTIADSFYQPSFRAALAGSVDRSDIPVANSSIQVVEDVSSIVGPLFSAAALTITDQTTAVFLVAALYACSSAALLFLARVVPSHRNQFRVSEMFSELRVALHSLRNDNGELYIVIVGTTVCAMFASAVLRYVFPAAILLIYSVEAYIGYASAIIAAGTVAGGILYTTVVSDPTPRLLMRAWVLYGLLFVCVSIALPQSLPLSVSLLPILGFVGAIVDITIMTNIQLLSKEDEVGRNFGLYASIANTGDAVSGLVAGVFAVVIGAFSLQAMAGSIAVAAAAVLKNLPEQPGDAK